VYDKFIKVGEEQAVYGNTCKCQTETDEKGRVIVVSLTTLHCSKIYTTKVAYLSKFIHIYV
jgi:hypothetical protein